jgi:hypothetical protein
VLISKARFPLDSDSKKSHCPLELFLSFKKEVQTIKDSLSTFSLSLKTLYL